MSGLAVMAFVGSVVLANVLTTTLGFVPVGFGLEATAGTFVAGAALALRDVVQDKCGRRWVVGAIAAGAVLSWAVATPMIALASSLAFLVSELLDFAVYSPMRARSRFGGGRWAVAVVASNAVGAVADTVVFLTIAFGAAAIMPALPGQLVGKGWATVVFLLIGWVVSRALLRHAERAEGA